MYTEISVFKINQLNFFLLVANS